MFGTLPLQPHGLPPVRRPQPRPRLQLTPGRSSPHQNAPATFRRHDDDWMSQIRGSQVAGFGGSRVAGFGGSQGDAAVAGSVPKRPMAWATTRAAASAPPRAKVRPVDRTTTRLNSSQYSATRMPASA